MIAQVFNVGSLFSNLEQEFVAFQVCDHWDRDLENELRIQAKAHQLEEVDRLIQENIILVSVVELHVIHNESEFIFSRVF